MTVKELIKILATRELNSTIVLGCCQSSTYGHDVTSILGDGPGGTVILFTGTEIIDTYDYDFEDDDEDED